MESGKDKTEHEWAPCSELDRKIEDLKEGREQEKEDKLEKLIIQMIVSLTLKEYYEKSDILKHQFCAYFQTYSNSSRSITPIVPFLESIEGHGSRTYTLLSMILSTIIACWVLEFLGKTKAIQLPSSESFLAISISVILGLNFIPKSILKSLKISFITSIIPSGKVPVSSVVLAKFRTILEQLANWEKSRK